jgi:hypothetical protein
MRFSLALLIMLLTQALLLAEDHGNGSKSESTPPKISAEQVREANDLIHRQFGDGFMLVADAEPPILTGDFDGDGIEDVAFVASAKKLPHVDTSAGYHMIDPYDDFFGFSNPQVTVRFNGAEPDRARYLLIVHGSGPEAWHASSPKSKYVVINLPFDSLEVTEFRWKKKKKPIVGIEATETATLSSMLFWDGKKYRWQPTGGDSF